MGDRGDLRGAGFEQPEIAGRFEIDRRGALGDPGLQLLEIEAAGFFVVAEGDDIDRLAVALKEVVGK